MSKCDTCYWDSYCAGRRCEECEHRNDAGDCLCYLEESGREDCPYYEYDERIDYGNEND